jgi:beta-galactosidase
MKSKVIVIYLFCSFVSIGLFGQQKAQIFDSDWKFHRGGAQGAEQPGFDDSSWHALDLPHDWSIEDLPGTDSPFNPDAISQVSGGFTTGGTGWYRKKFDIPASQTGKRIYILFDGVYMNAEIWINGESLGSHPYGYTSFWFDMTDKVKFDGPNILAVKVRNEGENSRWYSGSGIYRHVWLKVLDPVHVAQWGTSITTPEVTAALAKVNIRTTITNLSENEAKVRITTRILNSKGIETTKTELEKTIVRKGESEFEQDVVIVNPDLWSTETPVQYTAINEVYASDKLVDMAETKFGVRTIHFDTANGIQLNGKPLKLKGGCFHADNGPLGSKSYDRAEERRVELLKASGFNAIRCSHNPPAPALLDACDKLGMLVIDEAFDMWQYPKNPNDYHLYFEKWWQKDIRSMVIRDRNHPSVILWSIGNEIPGMDSPEVVNTAKTLADFIRKTDPTRPVIAAVNNLNPKKDPYFASLDIAGYNYGSGGDHLKNNIFTIDHQRIPSRIIIQTESYPLEAFQSWMDVLDHSWLLGDFVWTAFDYIGEASIGWRGYWQEQNFFPWNLAFCGDIDICGWKRPQSFYRDALWKENQLSIFVKPPESSFEENQNRMSWSKWHWPDALSDWNWKGYENKPLLVSVYSSCEEVELFLNNKSLGSKKTNRSTKFIASWNVPYQGGEVKAIGYRGKKQVNSTSLQTANEVSQIRIKADREKITADGQDLSYITIELTDNKGVRNPKAENLVKFEVEGPGTIVGVGNANPVSLESYQLKQRKAWLGRCLVIIKSEKKPGLIKLKVSSTGLPANEIIINSEADKSIKEISVSYEDGFYDGISRSKYTSEPYWGRIGFTIEEGSFNNIVFTIRDSALHETFNEKYEKHFQGNQLYIQQCRNDWQGVQTYPMKLSEVQNPDKVDAISGATWSYNIFQASLKAALKNQKK